MSRTFVKYKLKSVAVPTRSQSPFRRSTKFHVPFEGCELASSISLQVASLGMDFNPFKFPDVYHLTSKFWPPRAVAFKVFCLSDIKHDHRLLVECVALLKTSVTLTAIGMSFPGGGELEDQRVWAPPDFTMQWRALAGACIMIAYRTAVLIAWHAAWLACSAQHTLLWYKIKLKKIICIILDLHMIIVYLTL